MRPWYLMGNRECIIIIKWMLCSRPSHLCLFSYLPNHLFIPDTHMYRIQWWYCSFLWCKWQMRLITDWQSWVIKNVSFSTSDMWQWHNSCRGMNDWWWRSSRPKVAIGDGWVLTRTLHLTNYTGLIAQWRMDGFLPSCAVHLSLLIVIKKAEQQISNYSDMMCFWLPYNHCSM